jgi:hypothetical protein
VEGFIFAHKLQRSASSIAFRPVAKQKHHGGRAWERKAAYLKAARKQREWSVREERAREETQALRTHPLQLGPTSLVSITS